jgi:hypothetical protein
MAQKTMTTLEYSLLSMQLDKRAKVYERMNDARLRQMAKQAGINDGDYLYIHMHNAWVCRKSHPWAGVDYQILAQMQKVYARKWTARHIVNDYLSRIYRERVMPGFTR